MSNVTISVPASPLTGTVQFGASVAASIQPTRAEFYIDSILVSTDTAAPYAYTWDTSMAADGLHNLFVKVFYGSNQVATDQQTVTTFNVSVPPPAPTTQSSPESTTVPVVSGVATEGETLTVSLGVWTNSPTLYTRQWVHGDDPCCLLPGATTMGYKLSSDDVRKDAYLRGDGP